MTDTMLAPRSRSFQNCKETDIPGYNDCPSFLFNVSKKSNRRNKLHYVVKDTYGNTKLPATPPPVFTKKNMTVASNNNASNSEFSARGNSLDNSNETLNADEILMKISDIMNKRSRLSDKEYNFYKKKVDLNLPKSVNNPSTKTSLLQFLDVGDSKIKQADYLRKWMVMDITISNWCPSFLKLIENADD